LFRFVIAYLEGELHSARLLIIWSVAIKGEAMTQLRSKCGQASGAVDSAPVAAAAPVEEVRNTSTVNFIFVMLAACG